MVEVEDLRNNSTVLPTREERGESHGQAKEKIEFHFHVTLYTKL